MVRSALLVLTSLLLITLVRAEAPAPPRPQPSNTAAVLADQLRSFVQFGGFDDPETKIDDVFRYLERAYDVPFVINEKAFQNAQVEDVLNTRLGKELPKANNISLQVLLRKLLDRIPAEGGATWVVRNGYVEITTVAAQRAEFFPNRPNGPFPPLVNAEFEKRPLDAALKKLATDTDTNIVIDSRVGDKAKTPVTERLLNMPLDTAVLLLADMADLKSVRLDADYYVTTKENAEALRKEQEKRRAAPVEEAKPESKPKKDQ